MKQPVAAIIGATGTVGRGIARALRASGWAIIAVGREGDRLANLCDAFDGQITPVVGSVLDDRSAAKTAEEVARLQPALDAVITSINLPTISHRLIETGSEDLGNLLSGNLVSHLCAARAFLPMLSENGRYIGLGGGMADATVPGMGGVSMCQAAQRNMFRFLAQEYKGNGSIVELMLYSLIVDPVDEETSDPRWIRADEVGAHVLAVLDRPGDFPGPILTLKSRKQVGVPEQAQ